MERAGVAVVWAAGCAPGNHSGQNVARFDLTVFCHYKDLMKHLKQRKVKWLHFALHFSTLSRVRMRGCGRKSMALRSHQSPAGIHPKGARPAGVLADNLRVKRMVALAMIQLRAGMYFSIEDPLQSGLWHLPEVRRLAGKLGVIAVDGDQCVAGGPHRKPSRGLTNASWLTILEATCPGPPEHPRHVPLVGFAVRADGSSVRRAVQARVYSERLCSLIADAFVRSAGPGLVVERRTITAAGLHDPLAAATKRQLREEANLNCIGGLRNPFSAISHLPTWRRVGIAVRIALQEALKDAQDQPAAVLDMMGTDRAHGFDGSTLSQARRRVLDAVRHVSGRTPVCSLASQCSLPDHGLQAELLAALVAAAQDPDVSVPEWAQGKTPLGISMPILSHGIFPSLESRDEVSTMHEDDSEIYSSLQSSFRNYASFQDYKEAAEAELAKEAAKGYLVWSSDRQRLEREVGPLHLSKMAVLAKHKDGCVKLRLIHDLRRSGVNAKARIPERIVLPRLWDAVQDMLYAARCANGKPSLVEVAVFDFSDAFKHLVVHPSERRFLAGAAQLHGVDGFFYYRTVLFGAIAGPLVWGRLAALLMRATVAMFTKREFAPQCFVDDPIVVLCGDLETRRACFLVAVLFWETLGFTLAWRKARMGLQVQWLGASIEFVVADGQITGVAVTIAEDKAAKLAKGADELSKPQYCDRVCLKQYAGLASWVASVVPVLRPFVQMLWAAAASEPSAGETWAVVSTRRITLAFRWIYWFCNRGFATLPRHFPLIPAQAGAMLTFDASPVGGGAWIAVAGEEPTHFLATTWTQRDEQLLCATRGDPASQALWEAYALLLAIVAWSPLLRVEGRALRLHGDAQGVLQAVVTRKAKSPHLNLVILEIQLELGATMYDLTAAHFWSEENEIADALSRLPEGVAIPAALAKAERTPSTRRRKWRFLGQVPRDG